MVGVIASEATPASMALKQKMQAASSASSVPGSEHMSEVSRHRLAYQPALPGVLRGEPAPAAAAAAASATRATVQ